MFNRLLQLAAALFFVTVVMSLFSDAGWLFDLVSHFPVQSILVLLPLTLLALTRKLRMALVFSFVALMFNITTLIKTEWVADRNHITTDQIVDGRPYRLMTLNVLRGNNEYQQIGQLINKHMPDAVLILELTPGLAEYLSTHLKEHTYFFGRPIKRAAGIGFFSQRPMHNAQFLPLGNQYTPAIYMEQILGTKQNQTASTVHLIGIHPPAPIAADMYQKRNIQLRKLTAEVSNIDEPMVIAGDLNISPWSKDFKSLMKVGQLTDTRVGFGLQGTWPSCIPLLSIPIDHVLTSAGISVEDRRVVRIEGSDHCGVVADLWIH